MKERTQYPHVKPYTLVLIRLPSSYPGDPFRRTYIGEVMSYPTPEGTAMVRRVPGMPATLDELPVTCIEPLPEAKKYRYVHFAKVRGVGSFPEDMLRYDRAVPVNFKLVQDRLGRTVMELEPGETEAIVATCSPRRSDAWTTARWTSFMWGCKHLKTEVRGQQ